jgi:MFS family permease
LKICSSMRSIVLKKRTMSSQLFIFKKDCVKLHWLMLRTAAAGFAALAVAMGIGRFAFTPLLPLMQDDAGLSLADGGYLAAANYLGYLVGALWAARPARAARAIHASLLAIALSTAAMGLVDSMTAWLLLRFVAGVASAWALVHVSAWALPRLAGGGVLYSGVGSGMALAGLLCLGLMAFSVSSAHAWLVLGLVSFAVAACLWPLITDRSAAPSAQARGALRWTPDMVRLIICYGAFGFGYIIPATYVPAMAKALIPDPLAFGWAWPAFGATAAVSTVVAGRLVRRYGNRRVWGAAALAMAAGVAAPLLVPGATGIALAALLVGGSFMVITMAGLQEARATGGPQLMGAMTAAFAAGQIAGPLAVSALAHRPHGFAMALASAAVLLVLSAVALAKKESTCPT